MRLTGPRGSGRTALLHAVAAGISTAAPDGVIRLSGHRHTPADLLHALFAAVHDAPLHRPSGALLHESLATVGAVVLVDDLEFGGTGLDELLEATPECAYLFAALPDAVPPSPENHVEEVALCGLSRTGCLELLERATDRALSDEEADWAADLWLGCSGHVRTIVQGGTLLRQRDAYGPATRPGMPALTGVGGLGTGSTAISGRLCPRIADSLGEGARAVLRIAVALGGQVPHQSHLPALTDDSHVDDALGELEESGLLTGADDGRHRLADGVIPALTAAGLGDEDGERAEAAAQHYSWWTGHPSVTGERVREEADVVLASVHSAQRAGHASAAVLLARTAAPLLAAGPRWGVWERLLRTGQESARQSGDVAEQAYFHHELGVLALCSGNLERARAELEASIGLRGALADRRGAVAGRRALALVSDRMAEVSGAIAAFAQGLTGDEAAAVAEASSAPPARLQKATPPPFVPPAEPEPYALLGEEAITGRLPAADDDSIGTVISPTTVPAADEDPSRFSRGLAARGARRNMAAAGAGALLAAVLGTVITLGYASDGDDQSGETVGPDTSTSQPDNSPSADRPTDAAQGGTGGASDAPAPTTASDTHAPGAPGPSPSPTTSGSAHPSTRPGASGGTEGGTDGGSSTGGSGGNPSHSTTPSPSTSPSGSPSQSHSPTSTPSTSSSPGGTSSTDSGGTNGVPSTTASGTAPSTASAPSGSTRPSSGEPAIT